METMDNRSFKQKIEDAKWRAGEKVKDGIRWCSENKEIVVVALPVALGITKAAAGVAKKGLNAYQEKQLHDRRVYNHSTGHYYKLKRDLSSREWLEVDRRKANGEKLGEILESMKALK